MGIIKKGGTMVAREVGEQNDQNRNWRKESTREVVGIFSGRKQGARKGNEERGGGRKWEHSETSLTNKRKWKVEKKCGKDSHREGGGRFGNIEGDPNEKKKDKAFPIGESVRNWEGRKSNFFTEGKRRHHKRAGPRLHGGEPEVSHLLRWMVYLGLSSNFCRQGWFDIVDP